MSAGSQLPHTSSEPIQEVVGAQRPEKPEMELNPQWVVTH